MYQVGYLFQKLSCFSSEWILERIIKNDVILQTVNKQKSVFILQIEGNWSEDRGITLHYTSDQISTEYDWAVAIRR